MALDTTRIGPVLDVERMRRSHVAVIGVALMVFESFGDDAPTQSSPPLTVERA